MSGKLTVEEMQLRAKFLPEGSPSEYRRWLERLPRPTRIATISPIENGRVREDKSYEILRFDCKNPVYGILQNGRYGAGFAKPEELASLNTELHEVGTNRKYVSSDADLVRVMYTGAEDFVEGSWIVKSKKHHMKSTAVGAGDMQWPATKRLAEAFRVLKMCSDVAALA